MDDVVYNYRTAAGIITTSRFTTQNDFRLGKAMGVPYGLFLRIIPGNVRRKILSRLSSLCFIVTCDEVDGTGKDRPRARFQFLLRHVTCIRNRDGSLDHHVSFDVYLDFEGIIRARNMKYLLEHPRWNGHYQYSTMPVQHDKGVF
jgi:hypothetical protein